jgi:hypothetical protein
MKYNEYGLLCDTLLSKICLESVRNRKETCTRISFLRIWEERTTIIFWYVDPLLGNDREISDYTTAVAR